jgi:SMI1/KNR4 family protein SUKH-1
LIGYDFIREAIAALRRQDRELTYFGASRHRYRFNAPLAEREVAAFEQRYAIRLPEDYRGFLTNVGNGGAGPSSGLFKLGEMDGLRADEPWHEGAFIGTLRQPWPHRSAWNLPKEDLDVPADLAPEALDAAMDLCERKYWSEAVVAGAFPICHHGCALRDWLVVTGPEAGHVWHDSRADSRGLRPCEGADGRRQTFMDWYLDWLNGALLELGVKFVLGKSS